jgi:hypothetical protein
MLEELPRRKVLNNSLKPMSRREFTAADRRTVPIPWPQWEVATKTQVKWGFPNRRSTESGGAGSGHW